MILYRLLAMCMVFAALPALAEQTHHIDIPSQPLSKALRRFSEQSGLQIVYYARITEGRMSAEVAGELTASEALGRLLAGTSLVFEAVNEDTIAVRMAEADASPRVASVEERVRSEAADDQKAPGSFWERFRMAQATQGGAAQFSSVEQGGNQPASQKGPVELEEVLVTAQKREERLQDVPVPVTAISGETLVEHSQLRLQDYFTNIPGLTVTPENRGTGGDLAIRGLTTGGATNPTVAVVVDDVPYGSSTNLGGGSLTPDLDPSDLARVEVLRGPQGTLYGASSLGGLLKFVTIDPSSAAAGGRLQVGTSGVRNGDGAGYNVRGAVNEPLGDTFAIRASGFTRRDPGYVDNVLLGLNGVNWSDVYGGRLATLWRISPDTSLKFSALVQETRIHGSSQVDPTLADLQQDFVRGTGWYNQQMQAYSANFKTEFGAVSFTAVSAYSINAVADEFDVTAAFGRYTDRVFGVSGTPLLDHFKTKKFTQEVRLSAPINERLEWLLGAFYTDEHSRLEQNLLATDPLTGALAGEWMTTIAPTTYKEYAAFADLTYQATDQLDIQFGGRESQNKQTYSVTWTGVYDPILLHVPSPLVPPPADTKDNSFTYLVTPRFRASPDLMVYARLASGYRPGGPNSNSTLNRLPTFAPDKTQNYELGIKGNLLGRAMSFDGSLYYIDWKDIQLQVLDPISKAAIFINAGRAKSQGLEFSVEARPMAGTSITAWVALNDARLKEPFPTGSLAYGVTGSRLPNSSRFSGNLSLQQEFPLTSRTIGYVGASLYYVGARQGVFTGTALRQEFPAYAQTDLRAGVNCGSWSFALIVNNATDKRVAVGGGLGTADPFVLNDIRPRTIALNLSKSF